ncbi:Hypothetical protein BHY_1079 (plasmid) [Borrelia nietonii YOR]|uniref:Uncharacterized protein n=1 Tax=Borrelia nietonii YOR TaxID=1293576 RepID=W5SAS7_9SPIR|nr:hypothetical protein [Borrelia nietonii]AHH04030.1 Hypothetical protein BHY_1079 [Borrelia nietonii YOR]UPA09860.1 hypothetical protein bhYOR_001170 [Borrelia nietonii YOR]
MDIYNIIFNNKLKKLKIIMIIILLNSCKFKDEALGSEHGKGDAMKKLKDTRTPIQILLDDFNFSDEYKEAVFYIKKPLTDPNAGAQSNKTYTDAEFYDLLVNLGKDRLENIVEGMSVTLRTRKGIVDAIEALKDQAKKDKLNRSLAAADKRYFGFLKSLGSENTVDLVYGGLISHTGNPLFELIKTNAPDVFQNGVQQRVP